MRNNKWLRLLANLTGSVNPEAEGYYVFALPKSDSKSKKKGD